MKAYNSKSFLKIFLSIHQSDTVKILFPSLILMMGYSFAIYYLGIYVIKLGDDSTIKNVGLIHDVLGFVLSLLLVFRTNTAYDRWWEGRKLWGKLVNDSRNFAIKINSILDPDDLEDKKFFAKHISFFSHSLSRHLSKESTRLALDEDYSDLESISEGHIPMEIVNSMTIRLQSLYKKQKITGEQMIFLDTQLTGFMDVSGGCERIKNTPIPYSYASFIRKFILIYILAFPLAEVISIGLFIVPLTVFIFYVLMSLEVIAEEIEDPFNNSSIDLPTEMISQNIERNVHSILNSK